MYTSHVCLHIYVYLWIFIFYILGLLNTIFDVCVFPEQHLAIIENHLSHAQHGILVIFSI